MYLIWEYRKTESTFKTSMEYSSTNIWRCHLWLWHSYSFPIRCGEIFAAFAIELNSQTNETLWKIESWFLKISYFHLWFGLDPLVKLFLSCSVLPSAILFSHFLNITKHFLDRSFGNMNSFLFFCCSNEGCMRTGMFNYSFWAFKRIEITAMENPGNISPEKKFWEYFIFRG